jgi:replication factor A1
LKKLNREEIIARILSRRSDLKRDDLQRMVKNKMERVGELLTEEGALYMVANELGISLSNRKDLKTKISITDIMPGADDVTVYGKVMYVYPVKAFKKKNGAEGRVARFVIADKTGSINVVLWDQKTSIISQGKIVPNQYVRISHGYARAGLNERPELNIGRRGMVNVASTSVDTANFPEITFFNKIRNLREGDVSINLMGIIRQLSSISAFNKRDGRHGQVMRLLFDDGTGRINIVLWDEKVDAVRDFRKNDYVKLINGRVKKGLRDVLEIHMGKYSEIIILKETPKDLNIPSVFLTKIGDIKPVMTNVDFLGRVTQVGKIRQFARPTGEAGTVGDLHLLDETGSVRLSLWDNMATLLEKVSIGDVVLVEGAYIRDGTYGISVNLGKMGALIVNPDMMEAEKLPPSSCELANIDQLTTGLGNFIVQGSIIQEPIIRTVTTRTGQEIAVASFRIKDQTGEIRVSLWRDLADKVENILIDTEVRIKNAYVRMGFDGSLELSSNSMTEIEFVPKPENELFFTKLNKS